MKKEPGNEEGQQHFDDADKLMQEFQEAQVDRVGSRPSSNLSSLSNASERDQHHLGNCNTSDTKKEVLRMEHYLCFLVIMYCFCFIEHYIIVIRMKTSYFTMLLNLLVNIE